MSLMWHNVTEIKCNISGWVWLWNTESKQMQTYSIKWNYSSFWGGDFLYKSSPAQSINDIVLLDFSLILLPFISSNTTIYIFVKNSFFWNVYISVNTIFECCYLFFSWEIGHPLSTYATKEWREVIQNVYRRGQGERGITHHVYVRTYTHLLFSLSYDVSTHALSYGVLFYL